MMMVMDLALFTVFMFFVSVATHLYALYATRKSNAAGKTHQCELAAICYTRRSVVTSARCATELLGKQCEFVADLGERRLPAQTYQVP